MHTTTNTTEKPWLQLFVDAMTEKNPMRRLELVRQLKHMQKEDASDRIIEQRLTERPAKSKVSRRHR